MIAPTDNSVGCARVLAIYWTILKFNYGLLYQRFNTDRVQYALLADCHTELHGIVQ